MRADIFCRVVDNFGDIGVCWRLARRMAHGHAWQVRLWVDDLEAFARIQPGIEPRLARQTFHGIDIVQWSADTTELEPGDVVIEAFACDPPASFVQAMRRRQQQGAGPAPIWINLEYLSAESWVESCHALPSIRPDGLTKTFFFPGFTPATGGLLREPDLDVQRDALQSSRSLQEQFLRGLGLSDGLLDHWRAGARLVSLFCYHYAPIDALAQALTRDARPTLLMVPEGVAPGLEAELTRLGAPVPPAGRLPAHVQVARVPFVSQPDFDRILWCADLNFVRGEDSFVRAAWAARPLVWQIYAQDENAHLEKLEAWLARYPGPPEAQSVIRAWNMTSPAGGALVSQLPPAEPCPSPDDVQADAPFTTVLLSALQSPTWAKWQQAAREWDASQAARADLGDSLAEFCAELSKKR